MSFASTFSSLLLSVTVLSAQAGSLPASTPKPDPGPVKIPESKYRVKILPELAWAHPRMFLDAAGLKVLREKLKAPAAAPFVASLLANADFIAGEIPPTNPPNSEDPFRGFGNRLPTLALAYLLTDERKYLDAAEVWMKAIVGYPSWAGDRDLGAAHTIFGMAVAYDWLYSALTPEVRKEVEKSLLFHARLMASDGVKSLANGKFWGSAYFQNHCWINYTSLAAAGMALHDVYPAEAQDWLDLSRSVFQVTYEHFGVDGGNAEGGGYARYGTEWILQYIEALRGFSGEDLRDMPYLKGAAQFISDNIMPDGHSVVTFTDWSPSAHDISGESVYFWDAGYFKNGATEWFRQMRRNTLNIQPDNIPEGAISPFSLLWMDPAVKATPPDDKQLTKIYPDLGLVFFRTSWKEDAAMVAFGCGAPGGDYVMKNWESFGKTADAFGHHHPAANSFIFWTNNEWHVAAPGGYTHFKATHNENVWMANGEGQKGEAKWFEAKDYAGKQEQPRLLEVQSSDRAGYAVGEAGPAYKPESHIISFRRHLLFVKGETPYVVVYDKLAASEAVKWEAFFHAFQPFMMVKNAFSIGGNVAAYGAFVGPEDLSYDSHPLIVKDHSGDRDAQKGFELTVTPKGKTASTWLVTVVIGRKDLEIKVESKGSERVVRVGADTIAWDAQDRMTLNGQPISGNILSSSR